MVSKQTKQDQRNRTTRRPQLFALSWRRDSYGYDLSKDGKAIVRRGGPLVAYDPAIVDPPLHVLFGALGNQILQEGEGEVLDTPDVLFHKRRFQSEATALLAFVREFGFLGSPTWSAEGQDGRSEPLEHIAKQRRSLSLFFDFGTDSPGARVDEIFNRAAPPVNVKLVQGYGGHYRIDLEPQSLLAWMWGRAAEDATNKVRWHAPPCAYCDKPMPRGPGAYREHAQCCSDHCRTYFNRLDPKERQKRLRAIQQYRKGTR